MTAKRSAVELADLMEDVGSLSNVRVAYASFTHDEQERVFDEWCRRRHSKLMPPGTLVTLVNDKVLATATGEHVKVAAGVPLLVISSTMLPLPNLRCVCVWIDGHIAHGNVYDMYLKEA